MQILIKKIVVFLLALCLNYQYSLAQSFPQSVIYQGIEVVCDIIHIDSDKPVGIFSEGDDVKFQFKIADTLSKEGLSGVYPAAWLGANHQRESGVCQDKIKSYLSGSLLSRADLDMNVYYVLTLNEDASITVVDPLFGYGTTKLLARVQLEATGMDWVSTEKQDHIFVSLPSTQQVAVIQTSNWEVIKNIDLPFVPVHTVIQPDGRFLWVTMVSKNQEGLETTGVAVINLATLAIEKIIPTGMGWHEIALSDDSRFAFITNAKSNTVSVIDINSLTKLRDVFSEANPTNIDWSKQAQAALVGHKESGVLMVVDSKSEDPLALTTTEAGIEQITFSPNSRLAFIVNPARDLVHIFDMANNQIIQTASVEDEPDAVSFTDELAYVRHRNSETILMIPLDAIGQANTPVHVIDFPGGQHPAGKTNFPSPATGIIQAPGENAVLVANPLDRTVYYYMEGMAAPMGSFSNYGKEPRAVMVVDRSLQEADKGVYETVVNLSKSGYYDIAFFMNAPRLTHCFQLNVNADNAQELNRSIAKLGPLKIELIQPSSNDATLKFKIKDRRTGALETDLEDVQIMLLQNATQHFEKLWANPTHEAGIYAIDTSDIEVGNYQIFLQCDSKGFHMQKSPYWLFEKNL